MLHGHGGHSSCSKITELLFLAYVHVTPRLSGGREHRYHSGSRRRVVPARYAVLGWERFFGHASAGAEGFLPGQDSVSTVAYRYRVQVSRHADISRPDLQ